MLSAILRPAQMPSPVPTIDSANAVIIPARLPIHHPTELPRKAPSDPQIFVMLIIALRSRDVRRPQALDACSDSPGLTIGAG